MFEVRLWYPMMISLDETNYSDSYLQYSSTGDIPWTFHNFSNRESTTTSPGSRCRLQGAQRSLRRTEAQVSEMQVQRVVLQKNAYGTVVLSVLVGFSFFEDSFRVDLGLFVVGWFRNVFFLFYFDEFMSLLTSFRLS